MSKSELLAKLKKFGATDARAEAEVQRYLLAFDPDCAAADHVANAMLYSYSETFKEHRMETDDQLRIRIRYVAGDSRELGAAGAKLDEVADRYGLKRRKIKQAPLFPDYDKAFMRDYLGQWKEENQ